MTPTWTVKDHEFVQSDPSLYGTYAYLRNRVLSDFVVSVQFQVAADGAGARSPGIAFRSRNGSEGYYVQFDARGSQVLFQIMPPDRGGMETDIRRVDGVSIPPGQWHEATVEAEGKHFRVSLDRKVVLEADDGTFAAGCVGLRAGQGKIRFKNFSVKGAEGSLEQPWKITPVPKNMEAACDSSKLLKTGERVVAIKGEGYFPVMVKLGDGSLGAVVRGGATHLGIGGRLDYIRSIHAGIERLHQAGGFVGGPPGIPRR